MDDMIVTRVERAIRDARAGDERARERLLEDYRDYLRGLAHASLPRRLAPKVDCSDVVQESLWKASARFGQFRGDSEREWAAWLRQVLARTLLDTTRRFAKNRARDVGRERRLDGAVEASSAALRDLVTVSQTTPSQGAERREAGVAVTEALAELDPDHREVIVLRNLQGEEWSEVARRMGRSPDAVRMLWVRALARLRPLLEARL